MTPSTADYLVLTIFYTQGYNSCMKTSLAADVRCPCCYSSMELLVANERDGHIHDGAIACRSCRRSYPIFEGIALLAVIDKTWEPMLREIIAKIDIATNLASAGYEKSRVESSIAANDQTEKIMTGLFEDAVARLSITPETSILDVGAGFCGNARYFADLGADVVAQDTDLYHLKSVRFADDDDARKGDDPLALVTSVTAETYFSRVLADAHRIPFADSTFDIAFCRSTIHHLERSSRAIREMARVTRPGGLVLLVSEPTRSVLDHEREYLSGNFDYEEGLNEQIPIISSYTVPLRRYCGDVRVSYVLPGYKERTKKVFTYLGFDFRKHYHDGETLGFKRSFKLLLAGTGINVSGVRTGHKARKPALLSGRAVIGDASDLIIEIDSGASAGEEFERVKEISSSAHPYSTYSTLALTSTGQREGLKALYRRCLNPKSYPYSIALFRVGEEMLKGWEEPEQQGEHAYRYSRRNSTCVLRNKVSASRFCIMALGYPSEAGIATGHISINGIEASGYQLPAGSWTELRLEKPRTDDRILEIEISNDFTFVPDEVLGNGDTRELGIGVERIWQE